MRMSRGVLGWVVFILFSLMLVMMVMNNMTGRTKLTMDQFKHELEANNIEKVVIQSDRITGTLKEVTGHESGKGEKQFEVEWPPGAMDSQFTNYVLRECDGEVTFDSSTGVLFQLLINIVPWILVFAFIWFFVFRQLRGGGGAA